MHTTFHLKTPQMVACVTKFTLEIAKRIRLIDCISHKTFYLSFTAKGIQIDPQNICQAQNSGSQITDMLITVLFICLSREHRPHMAED